MRHLTPNGGRYRKVSKGNRVYDQSRSRSRDYKQEVLKAACGTLVKALNNNTTEYVEEMKYEVHEIKFIHEAYFSDAKENKEFKWDCGAPKQ